MKRETPKRLHDACSACSEVQGFCEGRSRTFFLSDRGLQLIVQKLVENIGEALRQAHVTDPSAVAVIPDLRDIVDTRNRLVHGYDDIDYGLLWDIVHDEIPSLHVTLEALLLDAPDISGGTTAR